VGNVGLSGSIHWTTKQYRNPLGKSRSKKNKNNMETPKTQRQVEVLLHYTIGASFSGPAHPASYPSN